MSNKQNDIFYEGVKEAFEELLAKNGRKGNYEDWLKGDREAWMKIGFSKDIFNNTKKGRDTMYKVKVNLIMENKGLEGACYLESKDATTGNPVYLREFNSVREAKEWAFENNYIIERRMWD